MKSKEQAGSQQWDAQEFAGTLGSLFSGADGPELSLDKIAYDFCLRIAKFMAATRFVDGSLHGPYQPKLLTKDYEMEYCFL